MTVALVQGGAAQQSFNSFSVHAFTLPCHVCAPARRGDDAFASVMVHKQSCPADVHGTDAAVLHATAAAMPPYVSGTRWCSRRAIDAVCLMTACGQMCKCDKHDVNKGRNAVAICNMLTCRSCRLT